MKEFETVCLLLKKQNGMAAGNGTELPPEKNPEKISKNLLFAVVFKKNGIRLLDSC